MNTGKCGRVRHSHGWGHGFKVVATIKTRLWQAGFSLAKSSFAEDLSLLK